jgi:hypothetical protein
MRIAALAIALVVSVVAIALGWQHLRYLSARRQIVQDRQPLLYPPATFHVVTFLRTRPGSNVIEELKKLRDDFEAAGATLIYAGRASFTALQSAQLPETEWEAVVLFSHPSREHYDTLAGNAGYGSALDRFERHYVHGLQRPQAVNLAIPFVLLGLRVSDALRGVPPATPFEPAPEQALDPHFRARRERMGSFRELAEFSEDAVVVVNLLKGGTAEQRAKNSAYGRRMAGMFARDAHGPMHMGSAVTLEGDADFDNVALVYYPGIEYFLAMAGSTFFNGIVGDKQLGDTLAVPTVPIGSRL